MKIKLPQFKPNASERKHVRKELDTARFIQTLWNAAGRRRRDPKFISLLVRCGWVNRGKDGESTRQWRNSNIADYLQVGYESEEQLARVLAAAFPTLNQPAALLRMNTGITLYHSPLRPATIEFVERHAGLIGTVFSQVSARRTKTDGDMRRAVKTLADLGFIRTLGREVSPLNGLTPTLACLDPTRAFPIMNVKTKQLLGVIGRGLDADGAVGLSHLIGLNGIKNAFDLDVFAATVDFRSVPKQRSRPSPSGRFRDVGLKSEIDSLAQIAASRKRIRKLHNALTNRLRDYLMWQHELVESEFDAVIPEWKPGRKLLIEAKTNSERSSGRTQVRQAIGQLFDYRHKFFDTEKAKVDLAILLPKEPSADIQALLGSLGIEVIWFKGEKLKGTIAL